MTRGNALCIDNVGLAIGVLWLSWLVLSIAYGAGQYVTRQAAIKAGAGHWEINAKTGEEVFVWGCDKE